ncbi:RNA ligase family protein [Aureibacter tunicatorum]|uniref:RNA ligase domain-containing protein n=2 Tax=Aureibacter tunicatorum TaxID=866807 RepID=A0AAE4BUY0_9BACT|nr:RNA ligase family protein [Aureibacter tunicatorum]MDR6241287.1 hypothetical protein [Aureibacter tunicatorum]
MKYPRSLHAQISKGTTSDDRFMPNGYVEAFSKMKNIVMTEKLDGQNNCISEKGVFARSHAQVSRHPWDKPLIERWNLIKGDLQDLEIFGENMYGTHSIVYEGLESYFYVFAVRNKDKWLSWDEVKFIAECFDFPTVPEIGLKFLLSDFISQHKDENQALGAWLKANLGMDWEESVLTAGQLGGYEEISQRPCSEGFVVRNAEEFSTNEGMLPVSKNEFDSLFKLVRMSHVKTDIHWSKTWKQARLIDYNKYKWYGYEYLSEK